MFSSQPTIKRSFDESSSLLEKMELQKKVRELSDEQTMLYRYLDVISGVLISISKSAENSLSKLHELKSFSGDFSKKNSIYNSIKDCYEGIK